VSLISLGWGGISGVSGSFVDLAISSISLGLKVLVWELPQSSELVLSLGM